MSRAHVLQSLNLPEREPGKVVKQPPAQVSQRVGDWQWRQDEQVRLLMAALGIEHYEARQQ